MIENIFYGSYYIQRAKSYLSDIIKNNDFVIIDEECIKTIKNTNNKKELQELAGKIKFSKIIGMEILSRHQRSLKTNTTGSNGRKDFRVNYKVFIEYFSDKIES